MYNHLDLRVQKNFVLFRIEIFLMELSLLHHFQLKLYGNFHSSGIIASIPGNRNSTSHWK